MMPCCPAFGLSLEAIIIRGYAAQPAGPSPRFPRRCQ
jgi:hypothetical protein